MAGRDRRRAARHFRRAGLAYDDTRFAWREARDEAQGLTVYFPNADPQGAGRRRPAGRGAKTQARLKSEYGLTLDRPSAHLRLLPARGLR